MNSLERFFHSSYGQSANTELSRFRQEFFLLAQSQGLPSRKNELWKYTPLAALRDFEFKTSTPSSFSAKDWIGKNIPLQKGLVVLVDGVLQEELSQLPHGIGVNFETIESRLEKKFNETKAVLSSIQSDYLSSLNNAFIKNGVVLEITDGCDECVELNIVSLITEASTAAPLFLRHLFLLGPSAKAKVFVSTISVTDAPSVAQSITQVSLAEGASLEMVILKDLSAGAIDISALKASVKTGATFKGTHLALGGQLNRNSFDVRLEEKSSTDLKGLTIARDRHVVDNQTDVQHLGPSCFSRQLFKGILAGEARSIYGGRVFIDKKAQQTDSDQLSTHLLFSEKAEVNTKPQLEVYADDVKATHGAAIGQIDDDQLFYLQSRGVPKKEAARLLSQAFVNDVTMNYSNDEMFVPISKRVQSAFENFVSGGDI